MAAAAVPSTGKINAPVRIVSAARVSRFPISEELRATSTVVTKPMSIVVSALTWARVYAFEIR